MKTDFLIVGQGIAGSLLAYRLLKTGATVKIVDNAAPHSSSKVAGGVINPITGKRWQKTWQADLLIPEAASFYQELELSLKTSFFKPVPVVRFFPDVYTANEWQRRIVDENLQDYVYPDYSFQAAEHFYVPFGYAALRHGYKMRTGILLSTLKDFFLAKGIRITASLEYSDLIVDQGRISWRDIIAKNIVFCEGWKATQNPWFSHLPFLPCKGEVLTIECPGLELRELVNRGIFIFPLDDGTFRVGSTYIWDDLSDNPSAMGRMELETKLRAILKLPYKTIDVRAAVRPTTKQRRPFLGTSPENPNIHIFNGLGTKGLLLAPWYSKVFSDYLINQILLPPEVSIQRFN